MLKLCSYFFVDERRRLIPKIFVNDNIKFRKQDQIVFFLYFHQFFLNICINFQRQNRLQNSFFFLRIDVKVNYFPSPRDQLRQNISNFRLFVFSFCRSTFQESFNLRIFGSCRERKFFILNVMKLEHINKKSTDSIFSTCKILNLYIPAFD